MIEPIVWSHSNTLVGMYFLKTLRDSFWPEKKGRVISAMEQGYYLCQCPQGYADAPQPLFLVHMGDIVDWDFFPSEQQWRHALEWTMRMAKFLAHNDESREGQP